MPTIVVDLDDLEISPTPSRSNGLGGTDDGYAKPAIYGDGGSGAYHALRANHAGRYQRHRQLRGQRTDDSGKITGPGGLVLGKLAPTMADEYGTIGDFPSGQQRYTGGTTINRGTVYLQKTGGFHSPFPRQRDHRRLDHSATGRTYLILKGSNQIASGGRHGLFRRQRRPKGLFRNARQQSNVWPESMIPAAQA